MSKCVSDSKMDCDQKDVRLFTWEGLILKLGENGSLILKSMTHILGLEWGELGGCS